MPTADSTTSDLRVAIVGSGAMGGVFGGRLTEAGVRTTLLDTDHQLVSLLNSRGLRVVENAAERTIAVHASAEPSRLGPQDVLMFFVKSHQTRPAAAFVRDLVGRRTRVVSLQNGWGNADVLSAEFGPECLTVGVTYTSATALEPGLVSTPGPGRTVLGPYSDDRVSVAGQDSLDDPVVGALRAAGFPVEQSERVLTEIWKKLVLNAATLPTAALTGLSAGQLNRSTEMRALVNAAAAEAVEAGRARGFDVELDERLGSIHSVLDGAGSGKGSMLQDIEAGRRTEIDVMSGAVLRVAEEHGLEVPTTRALYALVSGLERARGQR